MKYIFILCLLFSNVVYSDFNNSVFNNKPGRYKGTFNGNLFYDRILNYNKSNKIENINIHGVKAELSVDHDPDEIYDKYYKIYATDITPNNIKIIYTTYARANKLQIVISNITYQISTIDGGCLNSINGIISSYKKTGNSELLILAFNKNISLNNLHFLDQNYDSIKSNMNDGNYLSYDNYITLNKAELIIKTNTLLTFDIRSK